MLKGKKREILEIFFYLFIIWIINMDSNKWVFQNNNGKYMLMNNNKKYSGSGFIIFEENDNNPYILLVITKSDRDNSFICEDMGGGIGRDFIASFDTPFLNAVKEVYEESLCLFRFYNSNKSKYLDISTPDDSIYRCFYIMIKNIDNLSNLNNLFEHNKKIVRNITTGDEWNETYGLVRFYVKDIFTAILENPNNEEIKCQSIDGKNYSIRKRTVRCLRKLIENRNIIKYISNNVSNYIVKKNTHNDSLFMDIITYIFD